MLDRLWREGLLGQGLVSFARPAAGELRDQRLDGTDPAVRALLARLPLTIDQVASFGDQGYFAENMNFTWLHPPAVLRDCAMELVTETRSSGCRFVSEKAFKALLGRGPAVMVATAGTLAYLRSLGAATWPDEVDERYDEISDPDTRFAAAMDAAVRLIRQPGWKRADAVSARARKTRWLAESRKPWTTWLPSRRRAGEPVADGSCRLWREARLRAASAADWPVIRRLLVSAFLTRPGSFTQLEQTLRPERGLVAASGSRIVAHATSGERELASREHQASRARGHGRR